MTYQPDLSPCLYLSKNPRVLAVGWLDNIHPFERGSLSAEFIDRLTGVVKTASGWWGFRGIHHCELCPVVAPHEIARPVPMDVHMGSSNLLFPTDSVVYAAPSLILHYIVEHRYSPPPEFIAAVETCPPQGSAEHIRLIRGVAPDLATWVPPGGIPPVE